MTEAVKAIRDNRKLLTSFPYGGQHGTISICRERPEKSQMRNYMAPGHPVYIETRLDVIDDLPEVGSHLLTGADLDKKRISRHWPIPHIQ